MKLLVMYYGYNCPALTAKKIFEIMGPNGIDRKEFLFVSMPEN